MAADPKPTTARPARSTGNGRRSPADPTSTGHGGEMHQVAERGGPTLTTQQGVPVADDQNTLRVGERGPAALEDFHFREKIFHFDHERIPERVVHARGYGAHGYFENYESLTDLTRADLFQRAGERTPAFVRFSTVAGNKGSADLARDVRGFAVKLYTQGGQLGHRRQQHPGVLHPGRDQVPRPDPRGEAGARPRLPAGADGARQLLGLRLADARVDPHADVGDVGPGDPALVPLHGGLRRPHLPLRQRRRRVDVREVPLEAEAGHAVGGVGRGGEDQRRRPRLPPARPVGRDRAAATSRSGSSASSCSTTSSPTRSTSTCSTRPS